MLKKSVRWGSDIGHQKSIAPLDLQSELSEHGLRGKLAEGDLGFSRQKTRSIAKKDATDGIPMSEAITEDQWSEREQEVAGKAEQVRRGLGTWMSSSTTQVRNYIHDLTPIDINPDQLREAIKTEENEYRHYEVDDAADAQESHMAAIIELQQFRAEHEDRIGKRTPDIKKNVEQTIAILFFILIVEGCFNALLFKDAQSSGLLGGLIVAFSVSAVNVVLGVTAGFFGLRYMLNHPNIFAKIGGGLVTAACLSSGIFLNFFVAHFRDAVEVGLQAATAAGTISDFSMFQISPSHVVGDMFPNIFGFGNFIALGLLFIGLLVFAIAVYEGFDRISDRYPGYGRVWRKERKAYEARQAVRHGVRDDLSDYFTNCRRWFEEQQSRHIAAKREIEKAMNLLEMRRDQAVAIAQTAADQERAQKVAYRQAHRRQRNAVRDELGEQAAVPAYFDEILTPQLPSFEFKKEKDLANAALTSIDQNVRALNITREWLETHIQHVQKGLSSVEKKVGEEIAKIRSQKKSKKTEVSVDRALSA